MNKPLQGTPGAPGRLGGEVSRLGALCGRLGLWARAASGQEGDKCAADTQE